MIHKIIKLVICCSVMIAHGYRLFAQSGNPSAVTVYSPSGNTQVVPKSK